MPLTPAELWRARLGTAAALGFVLSMALAIVRYPVDASGRGYDFFAHYWCDLFDPVSESGMLNPARWWAVLGMAALGLGLASSFWSLRSELRGSVTALGLLGSFGVAAVAVVTALGLLDLHLALILGTGPAGLLGLVLGIVLQKRRGAFAAARSGYVLLALGAWNFVQYARQAVGGAERWSGLPAVQKAATLALLVWLLAGLWLPARRDVGK